MSRTYAFIAPPPKPGPGLDPNWHQQDHQYNLENEKLESLHDSNARVPGLGSWQEWKLKRSMHASLPACLLESQTQTGNQTKRFLYTTFFSHEMNTLYSWGVELV